MSRYLYVRQSLSADEELVHLGRFHWMYNVSAFMNVIWGAVSCFAVLYAAIYFQWHYGSGFYSYSWLGQVRELHPGLKLLAFLFFVLGWLGFARMMVIKASTEIAVTNTRLIYKRGLVARYVGEMSIDRIEGVNVLQSIPGRLLGYGRVMVRGMGVGEVVLPPLADPIAFRKAIERARTS